MGVRVAVECGVYVPRPHTELLVRRAAALHPDGGTAVDLCTGSGAIAAALRRLRPGVCVLATDLDQRAVACARRNGVEALLGDLDAPLPASLHGRVDLVTANPPYVPSGELPLLARDARGQEPAAALDGGADGLALVRRVAAAAARLLRPGGALLVEIGGDQGGAALRALAGAGLRDGCLHSDSWGDVRAAEARR
jgi:release factor glutamine methyltransferase